MVGKAKGIGVLTKWKHGEKRIRNLASFLVPWKLTNFLFTSKPQFLLKKKKKKNSQAFKEYLEK